MGLFQTSPKSERHSRLSLGLLAQVVICCLLSHSTTAQQEAEFPLVKQCRNDNKGPSLNTRSINFCMELGGGLLPKFPQAVCPDPNDILVITGYDLLSAKSLAESCHHSDLDGFTHYPAVNSSCLRQYGYSQHVKETILPLIKMYSGKTMAQMEDVNRNQYARLRATGSPDLSVHTWLGLFSKCVQMQTTSKLLISDICANTEQRGSDAALIKFNPQNGGYVNQTSCSCNIFSSSGSENGQILTARAVDIRLADTASRLLLQGRKNSRVLDAQELLYWDGDGILLSSPEQIFVKLDRLNYNFLPDRMWLEVKGANLTVNCGPADVPGGHQPLAKSSKSLGIGWIVAIIVGAIIVLVLLVVFVKCVFKGKRRRRKPKHEDNEYDISMGSKEDIRDRYKLHTVRQQMSTDSGVEPAIEIKTEAEVMCSNPRMVTSPRGENDESQKALLHGGDEEDDNGNINTTAKKPLEMPPPPPHDPHHHEFNLCRQLSYIDEDESMLPPPPPPTEDIYNHLNERQRPDVVPGNIYDTKPPQESHYSTTKPQKKRGLCGPQPEDNYAM